MNVLAHLSDAFLARHFDAATLGRARVVVAEGLVGRPDIVTLTASAVTATAEVLGTRPEPYVVQLHAEAPAEGYAGWLFSVCTCPVSASCKHGAALAMTLGRSFGAAGGSPEAGWRRTLARVADELDRARPDERVRTPLGLEFSIIGSRRGRTSLGASVHLRPVRRGTNKPWVRTGIDWSTFAAAAPPGHPREQGEALVALHRLWARHRTYAVAGVPPALDEFGDRLVVLLREAAEAGVELVPGSGVDRILVAPEDAEVVLDLSTDPDGAAHLRGTVQLDGAVWSGDDVIAVGSPSHAVVLRGPGRTGATGRGDGGDGGDLLVAGLVPPMPPAVRHLVTGSDVEVPPGDVDDLRASLRGLAQHLRIGSSDASFTPPPPLVPRLVLTVTWHSSTRAGLAWHWQYGDAPVEGVPVPPDDPALRCDLDARDRLGGVRDHAAEAAIRGQVPTALLRTRTAEDGEALALAVHELPHLRTVEGVEVLEQERPDFREAEGEPEITFDLVPPSPDEGWTDWLDLAVSVTVDGEPIPLPDVLAALTLGVDHLVLPSGLYVSTDHPRLERLREIVAAAAELRERDGDRIGIGRGDLGLWAQLDEAGVVDAEAATWVRRAQALRDLVDLPKPEPRGLATSLRHYQLEGFHWLAFLWQHGLGGVLADDMGLGKTLQVLTLIAHARAERPDDAPFLVVAPTSVVTAWASEAATHAPGLRVAVASRRTDDVAALAAENDVVVTTYTLLRLAESSYASLAWSAMVLDEAQQLKNHRSKTYAAARSVPAELRLAVTGTPFENRLIELWSLLSLTVPGLYPRPQQFTDQVVRPVERGEAMVLERFRRRIRPFMLRRTKELVAADLPPKQEQVLAVDLGARHRRIYDTHLAKERQRILGLVEDFDRNRVAVLSALTKLRQLALDPALVDPEHENVGSAKLDVLVDQLTELCAEGHRALVFSQFTSFLQRVRARLEDAGIDVAYLDGGTRDRAGAIADFREGRAPVFLISLKAGGTGLTLTEADYVFVLDPWWNPAAESQAVDRAHRIGQRAHVHVYRLVATDTIEEKVMALKARKAELFARVVDGDGTMAAGIDADDIRGLFGP